MNCSSFFHTPLPPPLPPPSFSLSFLKDVHHLDPMRFFPSVFPQRPPVLEFISIKKKRIFVLLPYCGCYNVIYNVNNVIKSVIFVIFFPIYF